MSASPRMLRDEVGNVPADVVSHAGDVSMTAFSDIDLYLCGAKTLVASWEANALTSHGAVVHCLPGVAAAVFPTEPGRSVYNNALLERDLAPAARADALDAMETAYAVAGVTRFAVWVHESDTAMSGALEQRGYTVDSSTRAMGMTLAGGDSPRPELELGSLEWEEYERVFELPAGLLNGTDHRVFHRVVAFLGGKPVATAMAFDHDHDCGVFNVMTLEGARRRGLGSALSALQLHDARDRGCLTASLQATPMAERVYMAVGFRDLGRIIEYVP